MNAPFDGLTDEAAKMLTEVFLTASGAELTIESRPAGHWPFHQNIPARRWRVTLVRRGRIWAFDYYTGVGLPTDYVPTAYDVLSVLTKREPPPFDQWLAEAGITPDIPAARAFAMYTAERAEYENVVQMFPEPEMLAALQQIS